MQPAPIEIRRHYQKLSERETEDAVAAIVELVVGFVKSGGCPDLNRPAFPSPPLRKTERAENQRR